MKVFEIPDIKFQNSKFWKIVIFLEFWVLALELGILVLECGAPGL